MLLSTPEILCRGVFFFFCLVMHYDVLDFLTRLAVVFLVDGRFIGPWE
jgi:hypothetical protein